MTTSSPSCPSLFCLFSLLFLSLSSFHLLSSPVSALSSSGDAQRSSLNASTTSSSVSAAGAARPGTLRFTLVTASAPWSARSIGAVELFPRPLSFTSQVTGNRVTIPANAFLLHGGSGAGTDVWVSSNHGRGWLLAAGSTAEGESASPPYDSTSFINYGAAAVLLDERSGAVYRIGGRQSVDSESDAVFRTTNGLQWTNVAENSRAPFDSQRFYAGAVANSRGELILQGGTYNNFRAYRSDVWRSTTQGRTWTLQTDAAAFGTRGIGVLLHSQHDDRMGGADILYLIGGQNEKDNSNEVWVSSDNGRQWLPLTLKAPFAQRDAFNGEITRDGVLVISAGLADRDVGLNEAPLNDVWVSLDGGYMWSECVEDAQWSDRYLQFTALDEEGYLYVMGGRSSEGGSLQQYNDVWRSSITFHDVDAIARTCNVVPPACGVGLRCFPSGDTVVAADGSFVSCAACPHPSLQSPSSSSSAASATQWQLLVLLFAALFAVTLLALLLILYRLRSAGGRPPFALPGSLQSWWANGSASGTTLLGSDDHVTDTSHTRM